MCKEKELAFSIYSIHSIAEQWGTTPSTVYETLNKTQIIDNYILPCYDTLHTQGKKALVEDITAFVREKGIEI